MDRAAGTVRVRPEAARQGRPPNPGLPLSRLRSDPAADPRAWLRGSRAELQVGRLRRRQAKPCLQQGAAPLQRPPRFEGRIELIKTKKQRSAPTSRVDLTGSLPGPTTRPALQLHERPKLHESPRAARLSFLGRSPSCPARRLRPSRPKRSRSSRSRASSGRPSSGSSGLYGPATAARTHTYRLSSAAVIAPPTP